MGHAPVARAERSLDSETAHLALIARARTSLSDLGSSRVAKSGHEERGARRLSSPTRPSFSRLVGRRRVDAAVPASGHF